MQVQRTKINLPSPKNTLSPLKVTFAAIHWDSEHERRQAQIAHKTMIVDALNQKGKQLQPWLAEQFFQDADGIYRLGGLLLGFQTVWSSLQPETRSNLHQGLVEGIKQFLETLPPYDRTPTRFVLSTKQLLLAKPSSKPRPLTAMYVICAPNQWSQMILKIKRHWPHLTAAQQQQCMESISKGLLNTLSNSRAETRN